MTKILRATFAGALAIVLWGQLATAQGPPFKDLDSFVKYVNSHIKAPFDRDSARLPVGGLKALLKTTTTCSTMSRPVVVEVGPTIPW
jgi:hypothetical protein